MGVLAGVEDHVFGRTPHGVRGLKCGSTKILLDGRRGRTPHGVRGLKYGLRQLIQRYGCRTPHGVRGLKFAHGLVTPSCQWSHPARGAWIEIAGSPGIGLSRPRRTPHGVRGLKSFSVDLVKLHRRVAPRTGCVD